jgi:uncharacterized protein
MGVDAKLKERLKKMVPAAQARALCERFVRTPGSSIAVRRFAGPESFVERLAAPVRVAHLTDLHVGRVTPHEIQLAAVELTNLAEPDLVVITGDFVCHGVAHLDALEEVIAALEAPVLAVLGNHDYWSGAREVRRMLHRAGAHVLRNAHTVLDLGGERLAVVGIDDPYTGHGDLRRAVKGLDPGVPAIGLTHVPEEADAMWEAGIPLVFAGHTHAGQITLARLHELALGKVVGHRYVHGLYGKRAGGPEGALYVGAGVGAAVMPVRIGDRGKREIAIFELGATPGAFDEHHEEQLPLPGRELTERRLARRARKLERKMRAARRKRNRLRGR